MMPTTTVQAAHPLTDLLIHDIRTPLATISGYAQLLLRRAAQGEPELAALVDGLQRIEEAAGRVGNLLGELADLQAQRGTPAGILHRQPTDLVQLARRVAADSERASLGKCHVVVLPAVPELVGRWDSARLARAIANLIDNALKYNLDDRPVVVTVQQVDAWAVINVADGGVGIPAAELPLIFERGYRASNVIGRFHGTGLGLAGVHHVVTEHGGTIVVESQIGIGTTATVRLPLEVSAR
jgi:signal transduction histidine kinase